MIKKIIALGFLNIRPTLHGIPARQRSWPARSAPLPLARATTTLRSPHLSTMLRDGKDGFGKDKETKAITSTKRQSVGSQGVRACRIRGSESATEHVVTLTRWFRMLRFAGCCIRIELRCLTPVKHAVVAHNANCPVPQGLEPRRVHWRPTARGLCIFPQNQKCELARIVDAGDDIIIDDSLTR